MLSRFDAMATVAVRDLAAARRFYGGTLGLEETGARDDTGVTTFRSGVCQIVVYVSEYAATNRATSVTWGLGASFDEVVAKLDAAGVPFAHYDMPDFPRVGHVHQLDGFEAAWFTDPDGNILHINND